MFVIALFYLTRSTLVGSIIMIFSKILSSGKNTVLHKSFKKKANPELIVKCYSASLPVV